MQSVCLGSKWALKQRREQELVAAFFHVSTLFLRGLPAWNVKHAHLDISFLHSWVNFLLSDYYHWNIIKLTYLYVSHITEYQLLKG